MYKVQGFNPVGRVWEKVSQTYDLERAKAHADERAKADNTRYRVMNSEREVVYRTEDSK